MPYNVNNKAEVQAFWDKAIAHQGVDEFRAKRRESKKDEKDIK
jgi:hypothetical protein